MKIKHLGANMTELTFKDGLRVLVSYEVPCAAFLPGTPTEYGRTEDRWIKSSRFVSRVTSQHLGQWLPRGVRAHAVDPEIIAEILGAR